MRKYQSLPLVIGIGTLLMQPVTGAYLHPPQVLAQTTALSPAQLRQLALSITVKIISGTGKGSGTLIRKQGQVYTVLTNQHVVKRGKQTRIQTADGRTHAAEVVTEANLAGKDLALVQFRSAGDYEVARFANLSRMAVNDPVYGAGYPFDAELSEDFILSTGKVLMVPERSLQEGYQIGYSNNIKKGMSGGPILNSEGKVIGVNGIHAYPLWGDPYRYEDGTPPSEAMRAAMNHLSWGIPIQTFAQLVPQYASPEAMPGDAMPSTVSPIADVMNEIARQITVLIQGKKGNGSGFIIAKQGNRYTVLTNEHVVRRRNEFEIVTPDGARYPVTKNENTVRTLPGVDLAVVQFDSDKDYRVARLGNYDLRGRFSDLTQDWYVFVSGWPGSNNGKFNRLFTAGRLFNKTWGAFQAKDRYSLNYGYELVYTNIAKPGVSGGPVLDVSGRVIGIHGRADGEFNLDTGRNIYLGYSLGVPVRSFVNLATKVGIEPEWLKIDTSSPPSLTKQEKESILETLVAEAKPRDINDAIDWLNYGNQLWRIGREEEAIAAFDRAIQLRPSLYQAWYARGIALYDEDREQEAIESFDRAIQGKENFAPAWRWRGQALYSIDRDEEALTSFEKAIAFDRKDSAAHIWRMVALDSLKRYEDMLHLCNQAIESSFDSRTRYIFYNDCGAVRFRLGDNEGAMANFNKAIELAPDLALAYGSRSGARLNLGDYQGALADANKAIALNPDLAEAYSNRGAARVNLGDKEGALPDFNKAIELNPDRAEIYVNRGLLRVLQRDYQQALVDFNKAIEINPDIPHVYVNRGLVRYKQGDYSAALSDFNQALSLDKNFWLAIANIGSVKYEMGEKDAGIEHWQKAVAINTEDASLKMALAVGLYDRGNIDRGLATAEEALKLDKRMGDLEYLKEEQLWGEKLVADARKLLAHPRMQALLSQAE